MKTANLNLILALVLLVTLAGCNSATGEPPEASLSPALSPSAEGSPSHESSSSPEAQVSAQISAAPHGEGVAVLYAEAWSDVFSEMTLLGRVVGGKWEPATLGISAASGDGSSPVECESPLIKTGDSLYIRAGYEGLHQDSMAGDIRLYPLEGDGGRVSVSSGNWQIDGGGPALAFTSAQPRGTVLPLTVDGSTGSITADFDGDGQDEIIRFEYVETASVLKRTLEKNGEVTELERVPCNDFSAFYACAVDVEGSGQYWLFERSTELMSGYFAFSGWTGGMMSMLTHVFY